MLCETVLSVNASVFGPVEPISAKSGSLQAADVPVQRSIRKPSSLFELSVQVRSTWFDATGLAVRLLGAAGTWGPAANVVAQSLFEKPENRLRPCRSR